MKLKYLAIAVLSISLLSCGGEKEKSVTPKKEEIKKEEALETVKIETNADKGVGPITSLTLGEIDQAMAVEGKAIYRAKCTACHKLSKRFVGPALKGITERRTPEWIMNMILNPEVMVVENEAAKQLLIEYSAPMANQSLTEDEARKILEYFRTKN